MSILSYPFGIHLSTWRAAGWRIKLLDTLESLQVREGSFSLGGGAILLPRKLHCSQPLLSKSNRLSDLNLLDLETFLWPPNGTANGKAISQKILFLSITGPSSMLFPLAYISPITVRHWNPVAYLLCFTCSQQIWANSCSTNLRFRACY